MNTSFQKLKLSSLLATAFCTLSINALAETYTVQVELNSTIGETPLDITETQTMSYPVLKVDQATKEGAKCVANSKTNSLGFDEQLASNVNSLCPGATALHSILQLKGVPNALVTIEHVIDIQEQSGVRFAHWDGLDYQKVYTRQLSAGDGIFNTGLTSSITLIDKSQVTDTVMEFIYDISAAYQ